MDAGAHGSTLRSNSCCMELTAWEFRQVISYVSVKVSTCCHFVSPFMLSFKVRDNMSCGSGPGSRGVSCTGFLGLESVCMFIWLLYAFSLSFLEPL